MRLDSWNVALLLTAPFAAAACSEPGACLLNIEPGVEVEVRDRLTNDFLLTTPRGVVREGDFQDSLRVGGTTFENPPRVVTLMGADERSGRYVVQIEADGYLPWDTAGVQAGEGDCHVRTARFSAALDPAP
jgi:hypothetical protein